MNIQKKAFKNLVVYTKSPEVQNYRKAINHRKFGLVSLAFKQI